MSNWVQKGNAKTIREYIRQSTGMDPDVLANQKNTPSWMIGGMTRAYKVISNAMHAGQHITVFGDYDADGIGATAILWMTIRRFLPSDRISVRLPKRFTEGYGITESAIDDIEPGLVICVDNGIAAVEAMKHARELGLTVCVLDHHLAPAEESIRADVIVDQHVESSRQDYELPDGGYTEKQGDIEDPEEAFIDYCGAGLAYKLAEMFVAGAPDEALFLEKIVAIASISTVADSVTLMGENRNIVKRGLEAINKSIEPGAVAENRHVTYGLLSILHALKVNKINETDIGFKLAPLLNAPGRLINDGARVPCAMLCQDSHEIPDKAKLLLDLNTERKAQTAAAVARAKELTKDTDAAPIIVFDEAASKGIVGIVAGQLSEEYGMPAVVFALSEDGNAWEGSGRAGSDAVNLKERLDMIADTMLHYGGHAGAAGVSVERGKEKEFCAAAKACMKDIHPIGEENTQYFDIETSLENIPLALGQMEQYAPFGQGNPAPKFLIDNVRVDGYAGKFGRLMGDKQQHIKFTAIQPQSFGANKPLKIDILGFDQAQKYIALGNPGKFSVIGTLSLKDDAYGKAIQVMAEDFGI